MATDTPPSREQCEMLCDEWGPHFFSGDASRLGGGMSALDAGYPLRVYHWMCDVEAGAVTCRGFPACDS